MTLHYAPTTPEEEELALALALSASLSSAARPTSSVATSRPPAPGHSSSAPSIRTTLPTNNTQLNRISRHSPASSPARARWPAGSSAPASPKGAAANLMFGRSPEIQPAGSPLGAAPSPLRPSRPPSAKRLFQPSSLPPPPQPPQSPKQFPRMSAVPAHLSVVPRSKSATGPSGLMGSGAGLAAGGSSSRSIGSAAAGSSGSSSRSAGSGGGAGPSAAPPPRPVSALRPPQLQVPPVPPQPGPAPQPQQPPGSPVRFQDPDVCAGCGRGFGVLNRTWITGMGRKWHAACFRCGFCREALSDGRGAFSYQLHPSDPRPYHPDCYRHVHHPLCHVCGSYIAANADGVISFRENGFWRERYCTGHPDEELKRCCACSRLQKQGEEWAPLPDDRPLCLHCLSSVVLDTPDAQPLYDEVLAFYRDEMKLNHPYRPPLLLVDGATLNSHAQAEGRDDSGGAPIFHVRGLCVATMYSHIPTVLRGMGGTIRSVSTELFSGSRGGASGSAGSSSGGGGGGGGVHCHVKVLLLLFGLPRLLSGSIMAHELMHAWLRMEGVVGLPLKVEEGLCQLMACLWLDRQHELLKGNPEEQRLASFFSYQIRTDTSDVYGGGFREAMEAFQSVGLMTMIRNAKKHGRFT